MSLKTISAVNSMSYEDFISTFGNVIDHCSLCAAAVWRDRPFSDVNSLHKSFCQFVDQLSTGGKEGILRLLPDLAGRLAMSDGLSKESTKEHQSAGLNTLTEQEKQNMHHLNQQYKQKFGFPFVICARENKKEAILTGLENRLKNFGETEAVTGVEEVKKICRLRLLDIVGSSSKL
ncbi:PRHOXNB [Mytilus edulis]|uniref:2-oxo-4-hydroxy-4-carboxy-5-ureidoimidazoline decarboxylase n=1 Tax=Mytilus edulis TaxID=6550 RepID=A0A8S3TQN0_MYTED|nr:PRHOXNB [Mytilus edulis]